MLLPGVARAEDSTYGIFKYSVGDDGKVTITGLADESATEIDIPATIDGKDVVAIGSNAFNNNGAIKSVNIPSSVNFATDGKLKTIGASAFADCHQLRSKIMIPASVEEICEYAFSSAWITSVTFGENSKLKKIGRGAFVSCYEISRIIIPASVEEIGDNLFSSCYSLKEIFLMRSPNSGDDISFYGKLLGGNSVAQLFVPNGSVDLYKEALSAYTDRILGFLLSDGLIFEEETTKDGFACVGFLGDELKNIVIPAKVLEKNVTSIGDNAFYRCSLLSSVSFAADCNLKTIGECAFQGTSLTSVSIPAIVETIGAAVFEGAPRLESVTFNRNVDGEDNLEHYSSDMFSDCIKLKIIYVPQASKDAYCAQLSDYQDKLVVYDTGTAQTLTDEKGITELETLTVFDKNTLSYSRQVETTTGEYATVCLPFAIDLSQTADVFEKVYVPETTMIHDKAHSDDTKDSFILMLKEQEADAEIPAGQPMFVKLAAGKDEFTFTNSGEVTLQKDMEPSAFNMTVLDWDGTSGLMTENLELAAPTSLVVVRLEDILGTRRIANILRSLSSNL